MGRELQKKKNRAKVPKIKKKRKLLPHGNKKINFLGNTLIAENWDKSLTPAQNYRRLGLASRLNAPSGGVEKNKAANASVAEQGPADSLHITGGSKQIAQIDPSEVRVERDPETGKIIRVVRDDSDNDANDVEITGHKRRRSNPLGDLLSELSDTESKSKLRAASLESTFIRDLELQAAQEIQIMTKRRPRQQSKREEEWISRLVERYGDNIQAMVRDRRLNPMQQTEGDLRRRIRIWKERQS